MNIIPIIGKSLDEIGHVWDTALTNDEMAVATFKTMHNVDNHSQGRQVPFVRWKKKTTYSLNLNENILIIDKYKSIFTIREPWSNRTEQIKYRNITIFPNSSGKIEGTPKSKRIDSPNEQPTSTFVLIVPNENLLLFQAWTIFTAYGNETICKM